MGMLSKKDFILRQAQEMSTLLAAVLGLRAGRRHQEALEKLATGADDLLGVPWSVLDRIDTASVALALAEPHKIRAYARLLREEAETLAEMGRESAFVRSRAAELIVEASRLPAGPVPSDRAELAALGDVDLPDRYAADAKRLRGG